MSEAEQEELSGRFFTDDKLFEELAIVENDLIDSFVRGELSDSEKKAFEQSYLKTAHRRKRVDTARALINITTELRSNLSAKKNEDAIVKTEKPTWIAWLRQPVFGFVWARSVAAVLIVLAILTTGFFILRYKNQTSNEVVKTPSPSPLPSSAPTPELATTNPTPTPLNVGNKNAIVNKSTKPETPKATVAVIFLGSTMRGLGNTPTAILKENTSGIKLQIEIKNVSYASYQIVVTRVAGSVVHTQKGIKQKGSLIETTIPSQVISQGDYLVKVEGTTDEGTTDVIKESYFKVRKP